MYLTDSEFAEVIKKTPMIAIDLCITNAKSILLGKRLNPPAQNFYFVPGGRIRKSETINNALDRIIYAETGRKIKEMSSIEFIGIYEHFYKDNFQGNYDFDSHYIVIAYKLEIKSLTDVDENFKSDQHSEYIWFNLTNPQNNNVHKNTIAYFSKLI